MQKSFRCVFDSKLKFQSHIASVKTSQKLNAMSKLTPCIDFNKKGLVVNAFFMTQFKYCPLIWMCYNSTYKNKINRLHEKCLQLIYNDKRSCLEDLLEKENFVFMHHKNIKALTMEMLKVHTKTSPEIMQ